MCGVVLLWRDRATLCNGEVFLQRDSVICGITREGLRDTALLDVTVEGPRNSVCVTARCFCRGTARHHGITRKGPRDAV